MDYREIYNKTKNYYFEKRKNKLIRYCFLSSFLVLFFSSFFTALLFTEIFNKIQILFGISTISSFLGIIFSEIKKIELKSKYNNYFSYCNLMNIRCNYLKNNKLCIIFDYRKEQIIFCDENYKVYDIKQKEKTNDDNINNDNNNNYNKYTSIDEYQNDIYMENLSNNYYDIDFSIGREKELRKLLETLYSVKTNPIIVGEHGVGKTSLIKGLAYKIQKGDVPDVFKNKQIYKVDINELVSNTKYVGVLNEKMKKFIKFAKDQNKIFFIDEIHTIIGAGSGSKSDLDIANILKPYIENGDIKIIGATTKEEYEKFLSQDKAFNSRFSKIILEEPDDKTLSIIIKENIKYFENYYKIKFLNDNIVNIVIEYLIELTSKKHRDYKDFEYNPRLVIQIIDLAFVKCKLDNRNIVNLSDICNAINDNNKISKPSKNNIINKINNEDINENNLNQKIIKLNFKK